MLKKKGHTVLTANSFDEAVKQIRTHKPDIVFTDFQLGRSDQTGLHVAREAKKHNHNVRVRVHSMGAVELKKANEVLRSFGLLPQNIYEKRRLAQLLGLPEREHVYFDPRFIDFIAKNKKFFPGGVIKFGLNGRVEDIVAKRPSEIVFVGDLATGRTSRSLCYLLGKFSGNEIIFVSPENLRMKDDIKEYLDKHGINWKEENDLEKVLPTTDIIYITRIQKERMSEEEYEKAKGKYVINETTLKLVRKEARIMHPLPHVEEIDLPIEIEQKDERIAYFRQAENGLYTRMSLLLELLK